MQNQNLLQPNGFIVSISRLPNVSFWCNSVTLPGISISNPEQFNPFSKIPVPGDRADFESLVLQFNVDENLTNWMEVMKWFIGFSFPENHDQFKFGLLDAGGSINGTEKNFYSDVSITVLSSHKNPIATFTYYDCLPTSVSAIDLTIMDQDVVPIPCSVTLDFSHFSINKPSTTELMDLLKPTTAV